MTKIIAAASNARRKEDVKIFQTALSPDKVIEIIKKAEQQDTRTSEERLSQIKMQKYGGIR